MIALLFFGGLIQTDQVFAEESNGCATEETDRTVSEELNSEKSAEPISLYQSSQWENRLKITKVDKEDHSIKLAGAEFLLEGKINSSYSKTLKTNSNGELVFDNIPNGYYLLTETKAPSEYKGSVEKTVYVSNEGISVYDIDKKKQRVRRVRSISQPIASLKQTVELSTHQGSFRGSYPMLNVTSADAMSWHLEMKLSNSVKEGDTFSIQFDEKINPGSLTEPYNGPLIYFKGETGGKPAAIPTYDRENNILTYTFTDRVNGSKGSELNINFDSLGVRNWNQNLRPNDVNYFTNRITGVEGGDAVFSKDLYVNYGDDDASLINAYSKDNWATGFFSDVDRRGNGEYVDYVYYVNMKPGNKPNGIGRWNLNQRKVSFTTSPAFNIKPVETHVYRIPDSEKNQLMVRSFPNPTNPYLSSYQYVNKLWDKEVTDKCKFQWERVHITESSNMDTAYTVLLPWPEAPHHGDGFIVHLRYKLNNSSSEAYVYNRWHQLKQSDGTGLGKVYQSAGGKRGPVEKSIEIENEKIKKEKIKLTIHKTDENKIPLKGAEFQLQKDGNVIASGITDENGNLELSNLDYGKYVMVETKAPPGYLKLEKPKVVNIVKSKDISKNQGKYIKYLCNVVNKENHIDFVKTDEKGNPVKNTGTFTLKRDGKKYGNDLHNDSKGRISLRKLPKGKYKLYEKKAPFGYELPDGHVAEFTVDEDGHILDVKSLHSSGKLETGTEIVNRKRKLPYTAGETPLYMIGAGLATAVVGILGMRKKKQQDNPLED